MTRDYLYVDPTIFATTLIAVRLIALPSQQRQEEEFWQGIGIAVCGGSSTCQITNMRQR